MKTQTYKQPVRSSSLRQQALKIVHYGSSRHCCICDSHVRRFGHYGHRVRQDARCPVCGSVERHRLTWAFFRTQTDLFSGKPLRMLHIAPEPAFETLLRRQEHLDYVTLDAQDHSADLVADLHELPCEDDSFDVIHCSHVLEHVRDDRHVMRQLSRVLKPTGWATLLVPVFADRSHEDPSITDPQERARLYGQWDHVRAYGPDFIDRVRENGFQVDKVTAREVEADEDERMRQRFGDEELFLCRSTT